MGRKRAKPCGARPGSKQFVNGNFKRWKLLKLIFHRYFFDICVCEFDEPTDEVILLQLKFLVKNYAVYIVLALSLLPCEFLEVIIFSSGQNILPIKN